MAAPRLTTTDGPRWSAGDSSSSGRQQRVGGSSHSSRGPPRRRVTDAPSNRPSADGPPRVGGHASGKRHARVPRGALAAAAAAGADAVAGNGPCGGRTAPDADGGAGGASCSAGHAQAQRPPAADCSQRVCRLKRGLFSEFPGLERPERLETTPAQGRPFDPPQIPRSWYQTIFMFGCYFLPCSHSRLLLLSR